MKRFLLLLFICFSSAKLFAQTANRSYPVAVMFSSYCCGVPDDAPLIKAINSFKKKNKIKKISYDKIGPMGKEGEYEMAFSLKELTKKQKTAFIKMLKATAPLLKDKGGASAEENITVKKEELAPFVVIEKKYI